MMISFVLRKKIMITVMKQINHEKKDPICGDSKETNQP
jgi:hypothetical protein